MVYCEACGAANETATGQCFACEQPFVENNVHDMEFAHVQTPNDTDEKKSYDDEEIDYIRHKQPMLLRDGRYQILEQVGTGGFGAVYKGVDTLIGRRAVAIKEIRLQGLKPEEVIDATDTFNREVKILSGLKHPNLPRIYNSFTAPQHWYLIMDFIEGQTLETYLDEIDGHLSLDEVFSIGIQLCTVLEYLHTRQPPVIFRDLKPTNVMITAYKQAYLIDFGAARYFKEGRTKDTIAFGSPGYASPEQYGKAQTTPRSDIYSLGATLHQALSGKDPGESPFHFSFLPSIPADLETLILRMVEMDASKRPSNARVVRDELQRISAQHLRRLYPLPGTPPPSRQSPFGVGQPPPASWATSAPSVQQAQIQLGLPPTPAPRKRGISRRAASAMILLGIAGVAVMQNARWVWHNPAVDQSRPYGQPESNYMTLRLQKTFKGHTDSVTSVAWSPQTNSIASSSKDGTVKIWSPFSSGQEITQKVGQAAVNEVVWAPGGSQVAAISSDTLNPVAVWNDAGLSNSPPAVYGGPISGQMRSIGWSPDGSMLATSNGDETVRMIELSSPATGHIINYPAHEGPILKLKWSNSGGYLALANADNTVSIWDMAVTRGIDSTQLAKAGNMTGIGLPQNSSYATFSGHSGTVNAIAWTSSDDTVISGGEDQKVLVWNPSGKQALQTYQMPAVVNAIAWDASRSNFAVGCANGIVHVYHAFEDQPFTVLKDNGAAVNSIAWSPDGMSLVIGRDDSTATVWHLEPGEEMRGPRRWDDN